MTQNTANLKRDRKYSRQSLYKHTATQIYVQGCVIILNESVFAIPSLIANI